MPLVLRLVLELHRDAGERACVSRRNTLVGPACLFQRHVRRHGHERLYSTVDTLDAVEYRLCQLNR